LEGDWTNSKKMADFIAQSIDGVLHVSPKKEFKVTRERIRQMQAKAIEKIKHNIK